MMEMDTINLLRIVATVASFVVFVGILLWAWRQRDTRDFAEAAQLPFKEE